MLYTEAQIAPSEYNQIIKVHVLRWKLISAGSLLPVSSTTTSIGKDFAQCQRLLTFVWKVQTQTDGSLASPSPFLLAITVREPAARFYPSRDPLQTQST